MERCKNSFASKKNFFGYPVFKQEADKNDPTKKVDSALTMLDVKLECQESTEPSNIIWENL